MIVSEKQFPDVIGILPAAGVGSRMQGPFPKQYLTIGDRTLLELAVGELLRQPCIREVIVAISPDDRWFHTLPLAADRRVQVVIGGQTRANSVMAALRHAKQVAWVLVHDAVRPCLHQDDLCRLLAVTTYSEVGGILATPVRDTIKRARSGTQLVDHTVERNGLWHALTPQLFTLRLLRRCLEQALAEGVTVTDESSALEYCGYTPLLVPGRTDNIKVTCPEDLTLASLFFSQLANQGNIL
ncbi:MAG: 2-C-methyl-D-erythritol 4-phosphate cytidylyltransferase [Sodalis sp. Psp]|nr:2-C-methyl-D-erythritol 4-phosphate cytidylyltransferase [Sodalis sp. Psp]MCR3756782.1 2-C-methyl-D-erythritol 4-phosphate cytidylyltransferase [Sodalis sp. Ppy]